MKKEELNKNSLENTDGGVRGLSTNGNTQPLIILDGMQKEFESDNDKKIYRNDKTIYSDQEYFV